LKAIIYTKYGGSEVLQVKEMPKPLPKDDEVLIKVHAVSLNDWDWGLLQGDFINRIMYGLLNQISKYWAPTFQDVLKQLVKM
jgi:NADPH:quinone reductase-like Zn-dependent oxidoreductase